MPKANKGEKMILLLVADIALSAPVGRESIVLLNNDVMDLSQKEINALIATEGRLNMPEKGSIIFEQDLPSTHNEIFPYINFDGSGVKSDSLTSRNEVILSDKPTAALLESNIRCLGKSDSVWTVSDVEIYADTSLSLEFHLEPESIELLSKCTMAIASFRLIANGAREDVDLAYGASPVIAEGSKIRILTTLERNLLNISRVAGRDYQDVTEIFLEEAGGVAQ